MAACAAEFESFLTTDRLLKYHAELRARGVYAGHFAPFGLKRTGHANDGTLKFIPSDETYRVNGSEHYYFDTVVEFLKLYAYQDLGTKLAAERLQREGYRWKGRGETPISLVTPDKLLDLLRNMEVYRGLVDVELWEAAQRRYAARRGRHQNGNQRKRPPLLLWKLVRCVRCGRALYMSGRAPAPKTRHYKWTDLYQHPPSDCDGGKSCSAAKIDVQVWEQLQFLDQLGPSEKKAIRPVQFAVD